MKLRGGTPSPIVPMKFTRTVTKVTQSSIPVLDLGQKPFHRQKSPWTQQKHGLISLLGIHVVYDISRKPWDRVVQLKVLCTKCRVPIYEPLEMDKVYKVVLPSYLVNGGDGFQMIKDELLKHDSGKHKCLFLSCSQRYSAQKNWAEKSKAEETDAFVAGSLLLLLTTAQHWQASCHPFPSTHDPIYPTPGKTHLLEIGSL